MIINLNRLETAGRSATESVARFVSNTVATVYTIVFTWVTYVCMDIVPYKESNSYIFSKKLLTALLLGHEMPGLQEMVPAIYTSI